MLGTEACPRGTARYEGDLNCVSRNRVLILKSNVTEAPVLYKNNLIAAPSYSISLWIYLAT